MSVWQCSPGSHREAFSEMLSLGTNCSAEQGRDIKDFGSPWLWGLWVSCEVLRCGHLLPFAGRGEHTAKKVMAGSVIMETSGPAAFLALAQRLLTFDRHLVLTPERRLRDEPVLGTQLPSPQ